MEKRPFGRTGLQVSVLGFGGAPIGFLPTDRQRVADMLNLMLDSGANLIDTAAMYQGSEEMIGQSVGHRRKDFILVTKCGNSVPDITDPEWSPQLITKTVDRALKNLRADVLDVMLLHSCDMDILKRGDALDALVKARQAGKIRFAGYSGDNETAAYAAALPDIAVIQTSINIADQRNIDIVLPACRQHNVGVMAKRPIANAAWKDISQQQGLYQSYAKTYTDRLRAMNITPADLGFPGNSAQQWPGIALRFTLSQPGVHCAIIGTTNPENMRANIAAAGAGALPENAIKKLREAFTRAESASGATWTGQT